MSSQWLLRLTGGVLCVLFLLSSLGTPYRIVQAVIAVGVVLLVLQIPDTIDQVRDIREHLAKRRRADDAERS